MTPTVEKQESFNSSHGSEKVYENEHINSEDDEENFSEMIETLGASGVFDEWVMTPFYFYHSCTTTFSVFKKMWLYYQILYMKDAHRC